MASHFLEQIAIFAFASRTNHPTLAGRKVLQVSDLMREIMEDLSDKNIASTAVAEHHPILRTLQFVMQYRKTIFDALRYHRYANQAR